MYHTSGLPATEILPLGALKMRAPSFDLLVTGETQMSMDLNLIRSRSSIEALVAEKFVLKKSDSRFVGVEHDSLVVVPATGWYFWNSQREQGDVFDFVGRHLLNYGSAWNHRDAATFMEAVKFLAERAGISLDTNEDVRKSPTWAERQLIARLHDALLKTPAALAYVTEQRGWQRQTVEAARIGYMPQDKRTLLADLNLPDKWRSVLHKFPAEMIVYVHLDQGRLMYLSGRSMEGKRHYNPPREILGDRQPYYNHAYSADSDRVVVVEGQADAITFAEWNIPAIALGGMKLSDDLLTLLKRHKRVFVALDNTDDAREQSRVVAAALGRAAYLPQFPSAVKDANEWLEQHGATEEDARSMLNRAQSWIGAEIARVERLEGLERQDAIRDLFTLAADLDRFALAEFKEALAELGVKRATFNEMLRAARSKAPEEKEEEMPGIVDDGIPVLSPALGFHRDLALVTTCILERTKDDRLNIQPYLITSKREFKRLTDKQVLQIGGQEIALRVLPEGSEFLRRWRYSDIQRFLNGEAVSAGEVFQSVHDLFTQYVDFRSPIESRILTLWACGTYLYTMFPAYPYLALNGPKNSGKSTVMRVLQPIAFNMVTTSDPTGAAMFRLIHTTSCTVGIDEAERYHNPKDPGMQQIRQLLNSGYKAGMPAIRLIGEDMKPQAFDVYSPKILAAIAGLEDILASRCIAIPMRRTDKKMPCLPPNFDGAEIRHQLYTLALTHFEAIHRNYFDRPDLHKLHNRSGELWSPLVALAAFFEEEGGVTGLLDAISEAAQWDEQMSEGKALSDREEAVLQALDLMTRNEVGEMWIKASELRERVRGLLGYSQEQMGAAQWIGHILKRMQLTDPARRKHHVGGQLYAVQRTELIGHHAAL